jgi:hypothetical protein
MRRKSTQGELGFSLIELLHRRRYHFDNRGDSPAQTFVRAYGCTAKRSNRKHPVIEHSAGCL